MSYSLELKLYTSVHDTDVYLCDMAKMYAAPLEKQIADMYLTTANTFVILCAIEEMSAIEYALKGVEAVHQEDSRFPKIVGLQWQYMNMARDGTLRVAFQAPVEADWGERLKQAVADLADKGKQMYDEKYETLKQSMRPPKEEVRWKQQQDRYRQKHHSKHFRK